MHRSKRKRNLIIFSLICVLLCMVAGYAAFQTQLKVTGSSTVTSNWDIQITNVTAGTSTGSAENTVAPSWDKLWASMEANLYDKGDAMEYDVTIENKGTLDAKLNDIITNLENSNNEAVIITFSGYTKGEVLKAGNTKVVHVKIEYNPEYKGGETSSEVEINFDYTQNNNETTPPESTYLLTYDYSTNGGTSVETEQEYFGSGNNVDLSNKATKEGWTFVGWNTDKDAETGLKEYQMPTQNTTLYAIYSKALNVIYEQGENVTNIGKTNDSCNIYNNQTSCEITLPSIAASNGYNQDGWYNNNDKVGNAEEQYNLSNNINLIANAIDNIKPTTPIITNSSNGEWTKDNIVVTLSSTDEGSGIDHYEWNNNGTWTSNNIVIENGVGSITFNTDNNSNIEFRAVDKAGNISEISSTPIKRDTIAPSCSSSGESSKWIALTQTITGTCSDAGSGCANTQISKTYSIAENITGNYDSSYSPGTVSDNVGNTTTCPSVRVRVTGTTLGDYTEGALFMYDGKTGLSNSTWQDQSGNNRNGTLVGAVKSGNALYCDGVDDYVRIAELNYPAVTLETSFMIASFRNSMMQIISNINVGGYNIWASNSTIYSQAYKNGAYRGPGISATTNKKYYASGRYNNQYSKVTLNEQTNTDNYSAAITYPTNNTYMVLCTNPFGNSDDPNNNENFHGYIYTARMYSSVLTDDQLQKHYVIDKWRFNF